MQVTRLKLKNWRNFREVDVPVGQRAYVLGANASGKSNLLLHLCGFVKVYWRAGIAATQAPSLRRAVERLKTLEAAS